MKKTEGLILILFLTFLTVEAGVRMVVEYEDAEGKERITHTTYIEKDRMRADVKGKEEEMTFIFRSDKEVFWSIDQKKKSYFEITKGDRAQMKRRMEEGMKMMEENLKNLPPEERKRVEEMWKGKSAPEGPKRLYKKVKSGEKVNQWLCDKYEVYEGNKKVEEVWATDGKKIGLKPEELKVMEDMGDFFSEITKDFSSRFYQVRREEKEGFSGIPVKIIGYEKGKRTFAMELKEVKREEMMANLFELPKGYKKEKFEIEEE